MKKILTLPFFLLSATCFAQNVGIGTGAPAARLQVVGDTFAIVPVLQVTAKYVGGVDVRGITSTSKPLDGWGYGVEGTGGFIGGYFSGAAGAYTGSAFGVYGVSTGTAGTRIGVYGTASGGTVNNWGGYFPTKTYISELRVGGERGATGYTAAINGKIIATEFTTLPLANWPDYVFGSDHQLLTIEELEKSINRDKHLPGVPSAREVEKTGINLGAMQTVTIEKVEENTLYIIQLNNKIKQQQAEIEKMKATNKQQEEKISEAVRRSNAELLQRIKKLEALMGKSNR